MECLAAAADVGGWVTLKIDICWPTTYQMGCLGLGLLG